MPIGAKSGADDSALVRVFLGRGVRIDCDDNSKEGRELALFDAESLNNIPPPECSFDIIEQLRMQLLAAKSGPFVFTADRFEEFC